MARADGVASCAVRGAAEGWTARVRRLKTHRLAFRDQIQQAGRATAPEDHQVSQPNREPSSGMSDENRAPASPETQESESVTYSMSPGLSGFLGAQCIALAVSSYQSGKF